MDNRLFSLCAAAVMLLSGCATHPKFVCTPSFDSFELSPGHNDDAGMRLISISRSRKVTVRYKDGKLASARPGEQFKLRDGSFREDRLISVDLSSGKLIIEQVEHVMVMCGNLHAGPYITLPKTLETILKSNPDIWVFPLDTPRQMAPGSSAEDHKRLHDLIEKQRKTSKELTEICKQQMLKIFLEPQNYWHGGYCISEEGPTFGMDIKAGGDTATVVFGYGMIHIFHHHEDEKYALMSDRGSAAFQQWIEVVLKEKGEK